MDYLFLALLAFLVVPNLLSRLFRISSLVPLVFLQLLCGVLLGSAPVAQALKAQHIDLLHGPLAGALEGIGWLGVLLLVALTGGETLAASDADGVEPRWRMAVISVGGFACTCAIGSLIGFVLVLGHPALAGALARPWIFAAGVGIALGVTALPVLAAIVRQGGFGGSQLARLALRCAMLDDLWLWLGMSVVLACAAPGAASPWRLAAGLVGYVAVMGALVRPMLQRWYGKRGDGSELDGFLMAVAVILMSAAITGLLGLHAIFGAFMAGAVLPRAAMTAWRDPVQQLIHALLLPAFFILTGMRLHVHVASPLFWQLTAVVTLGAVFGKMLTVALFARLTGMRWRQGLALGSLMQCKGLMELIAINILLERGIIGKEMFSALAVMAMVSTFATLPLARLWTGPAALAPERTPSARTAPTR